MRIVLGVLLLGVLTLASCREASKIAGLGACSEERQAIARDPAKAADLAVERGNRRLLAVREYAVWAPGATRQLMSQRGYTVLPNTSDNPADASCEYYQDEAKVYAEGYNRRVLQLSK